MTDEPRSRPQDNDGQLAPALERRTELPQRWRVLLHNDDFTTMEFVIEVLQRHFRKTPAEATRIMLLVHHEGVGAAGVYPREVAETKVAEVTAEARRAEMPLLVTLEPAESAAGGA